MITRTKIKNVYLSYTAGVIDSDGSISVYRSVLKHKDYKSPRFVLYVTVTNTEPNIVDFFQETFGGSWRKKIVRDRRNERPKIIENGKERIIIPRQIIYSWVVSSIKAMKFLKKVKPYLIAKKRQAELGIEFQKNILNRKMVEIKTRTGTTHRLAPEEVKKREWYRKTIIKLNKHLISGAETKRYDS